MVSIENVESILSDTQLCMTEEEFAQYVGSIFDDFHKKHYRGVK